MFLSLNWLKDFVSLPRSLKPEALGELLTKHVVEVDEVIRPADKYEKVVVGRIAEIRKHPNADRLKIALVDTGADKLSIVCGADNIKGGQFVPVALPGAVLPGGTEIKAAEVRGELSAGMLCAEDELGLGDNHTGIMILDKGAKIGKNFGEYLGLDDVVFAIDNKSLTHRPDLWSHTGIAREIAAVLGTSFKFTEPRPKTFEPAGETASFRVKIEDFSLCPRYMALVMGDIRIASSPKWLEERLVAVGVRPINNIVDVTNYVMLELGQPLHAFDRSLVDEIIVRRAAAGEAIETLDGVARRLENDMLVIADSQKPIAVAGVMGGANSEISDAASSVVIESANFDFISVRRTAQKLGLRTEASIRYEKSLDPSLCEAGLKRAAELIKKVCPTAKIMSKIVDEKKYTINQGPVNLDPAWLNARLGEAVPPERSKEILARLGFALDEKNGVWSVTVPTWRAGRDIRSPEDLLEEVARVYGYDRLPPRLPLVEMKPPAPNEEKKFERAVKRCLSGAPAFYETENSPFASEAALAKLGIDHSAHWRLANPLSLNEVLLRQSLVPGLLNNLRTNQARYAQICVFEAGGVYLSTESEILKKCDSEEKLPYQERRLGLAAAGEGRGYGFYRVKAAVDALLEDVYPLQARPEERYLALAEEIRPAWAESGAAASIFLAGKMIGTVCAIDPGCARKVGLKKEAAAAEISLKTLFEICRDAGEKQFIDFPKFPPAVRDLALVAKSKVRAADLMGEIRGFDPLVADVELFDSYAGGKLGPEERNLAFHIVYQSDRTLTSDEVDLLQQKLVRALAEKFAVKIRDF